MIAPLIALLLASHAPKARLSTDKVSHVAGWTLHVRYDFFAEKRMCRLLRQHVGYERQALVFDLGKRTDTSAAVYRIDGAPPISARDDQTDLVRLGFLLHDDNLDNPSGGLARIPETKLIGARNVRIAAGPHARPISFDIGGFAAARDSAAKAGCDTATFARPVP